MIRDIEESRKDATNEAMNQDRRIILLKGTFLIKGNTKSL
jgi:hypothetical protein